MSTYGFSYDNGRQLLKVARREGLSPHESASLTIPLRSGYERGIPFYNESSETVPKYGVMRLTGWFDRTATTPFRLKIDKPNTAFQGLYLINGPDEVASGGSSTGYFFLDENDENWALYNTANSPQTGESWGIANNSWALHKNGPGFLILGNAIASEERCLVMQYTLPHVIGKTDSSVFGGNDVTVSVWGGTLGSESDSGLNIEGCWLGMGYCPSNCPVVVSFINGFPYITGDHRTVIGQTGGISKGASGTFTIYNNGSSTGDSMTATALGAAITASKYATAWQEEKSGNWYCAPWECA